MNPINQPIVIFGGYLSYTGHYRGMRADLAAISGQKVSIVTTKVYDWLPIITVKGWIYLLRKLDQAVLNASKNSPQGEVIIFGHSIGGVLARVYLLEDPFPGKDFLGRDAVTKLVTLGSPHSNKGGLTRGGLLTRWIDKNYPGGPLSPKVKYTSIAGKYLRGINFGSTKEHWVYQNYKSICGKGNVWGDGLIPVDCALLEGSEKIILDGVSHTQIIGNSWYGDSETIRSIFNAMG